MPQKPPAAFEVNFDGLVGPTHNYGGLSYGNVASTTHRAMVASPREAVLQGLEKMKALSALGLRQAVLPPQERPDVGALRRIGFTGSDAEVIAAAAKRTPELLIACCSASSMWTANAATVAPSADAQDGKVHFTPANLNNKFHRSLEPEQTARALCAIFRDPASFVHHDPLPYGPYFGDEGAANHTRFCREYGEAGLQLFVYGRQAFAPGPAEPKRFPARQTRESCEALVRLHRLREESVVLAQQNPEAIDAGVFHNDVASVGNRGVFFVHEQAFLERQKTLDELRAAYLRLTGQELVVLEVKAAEVSVSDAVKSYLFNSQVVSLPSGEMALIAPMECEEVPAVKAYLARLKADAKSPIRQVRVFDLRQSMRNGGGPACLRLRVVLTPEEMSRSAPGVFFDDALHGKLRAWAQRRYRERLAPADLADPKLVDESRTALDELTQILGLGSIYPFQLARG